MFTGPLGYFGDLAFEDFIFQVKGPMTPNSKSIKWSAAPLPCSTFFLGFHEGKQGGGPDRGQNPLEWGDFPSVRTSVHPSVPPPCTLSH